MKITDIICAPGRTGFFFDDQRAIKRNAEPDGFTYRGEPITEGFTAIRQAGESVSVLLRLSDGQIAHGDCAAVQYSGAGGRDALFLSRDFIPVIMEQVAPLLVGKEFIGFRQAATLIERITDSKTGRQLHTAIRYGISQALLDAAAKSRHLLMAEVAADEYGTEVSREPIPIFTQSGDNRYDNVDKMILKGADVLPHGLINNVNTKLGADGGLLLDYVKWLSKRIHTLRPYEDYAPVLHIDVYGTLGLAFNEDNNRIVSYLAKLEKAAGPLKLRIEGPVDMEGREAQMEALAELTHMLDSNGVRVEVVADEWCNTLEDVRYFADNRAGHMIQIKTPDLGGIGNTIEAVLYCKQKSIGAYQGGTCNETNRSAEVCVHAAMASKPDQILAKPGMGVDEGFMIVYNEMQRILALTSPLSLR